MPTKGEYLKEKLGNMARWVEQELGKENLPVDVIAGINNRSEQEASVFAGALLSNKTMVTQRNWSGLLYAVTNSNLPAEVQTIMQLVYAHEPMHDKFWRYMDLFCEVAEQ